MNAVLLALAGFFAPAAPVPAPPLAEQIRGTWRLVSYQRKETPDAPWTRRFGDDPKGYLMYDATGHMMVAFEKMPPPPMFASGDDAAPSPAEAQAVYAGFVAYFGTYTVDEKAHAVIHHVEGSLNPRFFGTDQVRPATFAGDRLTLSDGKTFRVVWERVR
ncbi:MAG TPA: lipocalin-like domain-containing protein [Thermoanaerobaculia bacterium]|nr:lipocalin-like domain-containing protein [Thermoanaerobaculia bacterium]